MAPSPPSAVAVLPALLGLVGAGCASPGGPAVAPREVPGIEGRECDYMSSAETVAGWRGGAPGAAWWTADGARVSAPVTLSVRYGSDGRLEWVRPIHGATAEAGPLAEAVASEIEPTGDPLWGVRLRFVPGRPAEVLPAVVCEAAPSGDRPFLGGSGMVDLRELPRGTDRMRYVVEVQVAADGQPTAARVTMRTPPFPSLEATLVEAGMHQRYRPALHDGFPVAGTYTHKHTIRMRRRVR